MTKYFTIEDWSLAKWLVRTSSTLSHRRCDIAWANKVLGYFQTYIKIAKAYCKHYLGSWGQSIKYLWKDIRSFAKASDINGLLIKVRKAIQSSKRIVAHKINATYERISSRDKVKQGLKTAKSRRFVRLSNKTELIHQFFANGRPVR